MEGVIIREEKGRQMMKGQKSRDFYCINRFLLSLVMVLVSLTGMEAQTPGWTINFNQFQNTMSLVVSVSDECVPSMNPNSIVGVFDINGDIRGFDTTGVLGELAFVTVYSNVALGEELFFKVYDAATDGVYNVYNTSISFMANGTLGTVGSPMELIFDSSSSAGGSAGPDQILFNMTSALMAATGTGMWSVVEGAGGSFVDAGDRETIFMGALGTIYTLAWTQTDMDGCIGETDEVEIILILPENENFLRTCTDGLDNDNDGLIDCVDPDCGQPQIQDVTTMDPTSGSCAQSNFDGSLTIVHTSGDTFSIDGGLTFHPGATFGGLQSGVYQLVVRNQGTSCQTTGIGELGNPAGVTTTINDVVLDCVTEADTILMATGLNGTAPYSYEWKDEGGVVVGMNERVREGKYHVTVTDNAGCGDRDSLSITRGVDPINVLGMDLLTGPGILCKGQKDISYQSMIQSGMGWISWTHTGSNIAIDPSVDGKMAEVDFGVSATPGYLKVEVMNHCSEKADSIYTAFATDFICNQFANCTPSSLITTGLLLSVNVPAMYSTQTLMTIEAEIVNMPGSMFEPYYQFMAGQAIEFMPGFELGRGIEMAAEIKNCQK